MAESLERKLAEAAKKKAPRGLVDPVATDAAGPGKETARMAIGTGAPARRAAWRSRSRVNILARRRRRSWNGCVNRAISTPTIARR